MSDSQKREVAARFAMDAINLLRSGTHLDVCYRRLLAAANVLVAEVEQSVPIGAPALPENVTEYVAAYVAGAVDKP